MKFKLPPLPWEANALEPFLSAAAIESHYLGHHKAYVDKLNDLVVQLGVREFNLERLVLNADGVLYANAAQAWNHSFFWSGLTPKQKTAEGKGRFLAAVNSQYGSMDGLRRRFVDCASQLFGSGWTWLVLSDAGEISVVNTRNADNPLLFENSRPLWACDLWEHAHYVDYRSRRQAYVEGIWRYVDWAFVERNFAQQHKPEMTNWSQSSAGLDVPPPSLL